MSYLVLARKWRPQRFDDVIGQEHVARTLTGALEKNRVSHAYLFAGPRGVGKTTTARILAKALNCEKGPAAEPCNACETCLETTQGRSLDVLEIDGASTRGIDDIRNLRENVRFAPSRGRMKVYIIDEVHMLTGPAFNALLKTLEEPPPGVVFVLATTEPFKVPATILSRCQRFDFARIHPKRIAERLRFVAGEEGLAIDDEALELLAWRSEGGMRDALSLLDQISSSGEPHLDAKVVASLLGIAARDVQARLTNAIADRDPARAIAVLEETYYAGTDFGEMLDSLVSHFRNLLLLRLGAMPELALEAAGGGMEALRTEAVRYEPGDLLLATRSLLAARGAMRRSENPRFAMELVVAELATLDRVADLRSLLDKLGDGTGVGTGATASGAPGAGRPPDPPGRASTMPSPIPPASGLSSSMPSSSIPSSSVPSSGSSPPPAASGPARDGEALEAHWNRVLELLKVRLRSVYAFLEGSRLVSIDGPMARIEIRPGQAFAKDLLLEKANRKAIEAALTEELGAPLRLDIATASSPEDSTPGASPLAGTAPLPETETRRNTTPEWAVGDPLVRKAMELFDGEVL